MSDILRRCPVVSLDGVGLSEEKATGTTVL